MSYTMLWSNGLLRVSEIMCSNFNKYINFCLFLNDERFGKINKSIFLCLKGDRRLI